MYLSNLVLSVGGLYTPWVSNWRGKGICLDRNAARVKQEGPEKSEPDAVVYHSTYAKDAEIE